jgi:hypothetical protein
VDQVIPLGPGREHLRRAGEVLHPDREPPSVLEEIRRAMGSLEFSAQYQQRPVPAGGISSSGLGSKPACSEPPRR